MKGEVINVQSTLQEVLDIYPGAQRALFRHYHIGGCSSCAFQLSETLEALCQRHQLPTEEVMAQIQNSHEQDLELQISPAGLSELFQTQKASENSSVKLIDIRSREEFETTHLPGATFLSQPAMQEILSRWPRESLVIIYDHRGGQSLDAAAYFIGQGFRQVRCLRGGIDAWANEINRNMPRYRLESVV